MEFTTKHYITYFFPGAFFAEDSIQEVSDREPSHVTPPSRCFAFQFHSRKCATADDGTVLLGPIENKTGRYYIRGITYTADDIERLYPEKKILIANMRGNKWMHVVLCRTGNFQPLEPGDVVLS